MSTFKKNPFNNKPSRSFDSRSQQAPRELYDAECNSCHARCQVPFRPNGKKAVYCSNCFKQNDDRGVKPRFEDRGPSRERPSFAPRAAQPDTRIDGLKRQLDIMQATLDRLVSTVDSMNRATALTQVVRKHIPSAKPAEAPIKAVKKVAKKTATRAKKA